MATLKQFKDPMADYDLETLRAMYEEIFNEQAVTAEGVETTDKPMLITKIAYSHLLQHYAEQTDENGEPVAVPARVATMAQKAFDKPFVNKGVGSGQRKLTIQKFIVDRLVQAVQNQEQVTAEQLGREVCDMFPNSTYVKNPVGRMKTDINKFNKGLFKYAELNGLVPQNDSEKFVPYVEPKVAENTEE